VIGRPRPLLVNGHEVNTDNALERAAAASGYRIAPNVRVADVLPIYGSCLSSTEYSYALRSHFDWVVTEDEERIPQFAVEFDGSSHDTHEAAARDDLKDRIATQSTTEASIRGPSTRRASHRRPINRSRTASRLQCDADGDVHSGLHPADDGLVHRHYGDGQHQRSHRRPIGGMSVCG
jgi:hypothetical protein